MTDALPYVFKRITSMAGNGQIIEDKQLTVQGPDIDVCLKEFDKRWKEKDAK
jgi:hypothetical protein